MWLVLARLAVAAPSFVTTTDPRVAVLAAKAWVAATACAGREAPARDRVSIEIGDPGGGFVGRASTKGRRERVWRDGAGEVVRTEVLDEGGLERIVVRDTDARTVAHEVAHAWVPSGPPALVEGATDLLADCIAERARRTFATPPRPVGGLEALVDLRTWTNPDGDGPERAAGYAASARLMRGVAELVPRERLWRERWTWDDLRALLLAAPPPGPAMWEALEGGVEAQRELLGDVDADGLDGLTERARGTDPRRADTDGDGFFDGASGDVGDAVRLPGDGSVVCAGRAAGPLGATVRVDTWRPDGSTTAGRAWAEGARLRWGQGALEPVPTGASILVASEAGQPLARVHGLGLVDDRRCVSGRWTTVLGPREGREEAIAAFAGRAERLASAIEARVPSGKRLVIVLTGRPRWTTLEATWLPGNLVTAALEGPSPDYGAALAVAYARVRASPVPMDTGLVEALARTLVPAPTDPGALLSLDSQWIGSWVEAARACGWPAVLEARCAAAPTEDADAGAPLDLE